MLERGTNLVTAYAVDTKTSGTDLVEDSGVSIGLDSEVDLVIVFLGESCYGVESLSEQLGIVEVERRFHLLERGIREHGWHDGLGLLD